MSMLFLEQIKVRSNHFLGQNGSMDLLAFIGIMTSSLKGVDCRFLCYFSDFLWLFSIFWGQIWKFHWIEKFCSCPSLHLGPNSCRNCFSSCLAQFTTLHIAFSHAYKIGGVWLSLTVVSAPRTKLKVALTAEERIQGINQSRLGSLVQVQTRTTTLVLHPPPFEISTPPPFRWTSRLLLVLHNPRSWVP
jgi:hypothetical protein